jgi:glycosyltransferase involved in cell wall biosynthesis
MTVKQDVKQSISASQRSATATLRVCHVSMCLLTGGLERLLVEFGRHCNRDQFDLSFAALDGLGVPAEELSEMGYPVESIVDTSPGKVARLKRLTAMFKSQQIDVVHTHNTLAHFYGAMAAKVAKVPVVVNTQHGQGCGNSFKARMQFRLANRWTNQVIGVSEDSAQLCRKDDPKSAKKIRAIWNGIDVQRFDHRGPTFHPHAISVARLSPEKDFATLLRAVWILVKDYPKFHLKIVGDGSERTELEALVNQLHISKHVEFLGERNDVPDLLGQAGFFVSATTTEGISLTILEAMAVGLPIVTTDVGGNPEIVKEGETGRLVRCGSPEQLANAMREMLDEPDIWPVMGELGRRRVEDNFEIRNVVQQYEDLYQELSLNR